MNGVYKAKYCCHHGLVHFIATTVKKNYIYWTHAELVNDETAPFHVVTWLTCLLLAVIV